MQVESTTEVLTSQPDAWRASARRLAIELRRAFAETRMRLLAVTLLALVVRALFVGDKSIWSDEGVSILIARLDWPSFVSVLSRYEANMSLYYVLLRYWLALGDSEALIRSLSVVFAVATVPVLYLLANRLFGKEVGITAAFLLALNAFHLEHAQSARSYSLLMLLVALSSLYFVKSIEEPSRRNWIGYVLTAALAVYSQLFAALTLVSQWTSIMFVPGRRRLARTFVATVLGIAILLIPLGLFMLTTDLSAAEWLRRPGWRAVAGLFAALSGGKLLAPIYAAMCLMAVVSLFRRNTRSMTPHSIFSYAFVLTSLFLPIIIVLVVSMSRPAFAWRYMIVSLPAFIILSAVGVQQIAERRRRLGVVAIITVLAAVSIAAYYRSPDEESWRQATHYVLSNARPGDAILIYAGVIRGPFEYYLRRVGGWQPPILFPPPGYWPVRPAAGVEEGVVRRALHDAAKYERVWLVLSHDQLPSLGRPKVSKKIREELGRRFTAGTEAQFIRITVKLFGSTSTNAP